MLDNVQCFLIEPSPFAEVSLRRYVSQGADKYCGEHRLYHTATSGPIGQTTAWTDPTRGIDRYAELDPVPHDDPRWPVACDRCGRAFWEEDEWQQTGSRLYTAADGRLMTLANAEPGAMWDADWMHGHERWTGPDGKCLMVMLPDGHQWHIDGVCSNCNIEEPHKCWPRRGTPPLLTVDNTGAPAGHAGAGSIDSGTWHGFLTNGVLQSC